MARRDSVCYLLPSLSQTESQHFAHIPRFLEEISRSLDVYVLAERSDGLPALPGVREAVVLRAGTALGRMVQLALNAVRLRRLGCRRFFVRISPLAALTLAALQRPFDLQVYYWISGETATRMPLDIARQRPFLQRLLYRLTEWIQLAAMRKVAWFVTGPERMRDYFVRVYGLPRSRILLLYNDIDLARYSACRKEASKVERRMRLALPVEVPIVLFVGRVSYLKGGHDLPKIAQRLAHECPNALLLVVGAPYVPSVWDELSIQPNVRLFGAVPNEQTVDFYCASDVLILPSVSEGFPRVLLEAMALGVPFVAFDVGGVSDLVSPEQRKWVVPRGDVDELTTKAVELLQHPEKRRALGEEGLLRVESFDTHRVARMFVDLITATSTRLNRL